MKQNYCKREHKIKTIITLSLFSILLFFGCDQGSDITSPISDSNKITSVPLGSDDPDGNEQYLYPKIDFPSYPPGADSIFILQNLLPPEMPNVAVSQIVYGFYGGKIDFNYEYITEMIDTVTIKAQLNFPSGSFEGAAEISMIFNNEIGAISFYPHMVFSDTVKFKVTYTGLDLSGIDPNSIDFIFQNYDGTSEQIENAEMNIYVSTGKIELKGSELHHFSRYGFVNKQL